MHYLNKDDLQAMERLPRVNLINSLSGYKSANLIGTKSNDGKTNLAVFSSVIHLGSSPALLGFIMRPPVVPRHTYDNIIATKLYTINHIHTEQIANAHQTSGKYPEDISEFSACDFKEEYFEDFAPPFVSESRIKMGMRLVEEIPIPSNDCLLIVGEIQHLLLSDDYQKPNGSLDLNQAETVAISGLDSYHSTQHLRDMPYVSKKSLEL